LENLHCAHCANAERRSELRTTLHWSERLK
jgi:hypothetical protein